MRIDLVKPFVVGNPWKNWILVKVMTTDGHAGWGEATTGLTTRSTVGAVEEISRLFIGQDIRALVEVWHDAFKALYLPTDGAVLGAMAGIETACLDAFGKELGLPLYRLLGGRARQSIRTYANGWYQAEREPAVFAERAAAVASRGYSALKFDPLGHNYRTLDRTERKRVVDLVTAVRSALPDTVDLILEFHDRLTPVEALNLARAFAEIQPLWIEDPVWSEDVDVVASLAAASPVRIASGERLASPNQFVRLLSNGRMDMVLPEYLSLGGLQRMRDVAAIADAHGAMVAPHNAQSPLSTALNVHFDVAVPNAFIQECFDDYQGGWINDVFADYPLLRDGHLAPSEKPGHGVEINEEAISKYPYGHANFMNMFKAGWELRNSK